MRGFWAIASYCLLTSTLWAQADLKKGVTDLKDVDADFALQGEYFGTTLHQGCWRSCGLQVACLGNGAFTGHFYPGGLPGWGYAGGEKIKVDGGYRSSGAESPVELTGEGLRISLPAAGQPATVYSLASGETLGSLSKVTRVSPTMHALPPVQATVLFDGKNTDQLKNAKVNSEGNLEVGAETVGAWKDFWLHAEFRTPYMPFATSQARGNSGFYLQRRYEVQVLDSFALDPQFNDSAALYRFKAPDFNMAFPPLTWQTYDIQFVSPRFSDDGKTRLTKGRITVWHNGVVVQNNVELENKTGGGRPEGPELLPILFQQHGNPVHFRNIWLLDQTPSVNPIAAAPSSTFQQPISRREWRQYVRGR